MKRALLFGLCGAWVFSTASLEADPFVFVSLPDTQIYSEDRFPDLTNTPAVTDERGTGAIFFDQTQWIVDHAEAQGIRYVGHLGDIVQNGEILEEWSLAKAAMDLLLQADIPHGTVMGNHDDIPGGINGAHGLPYQQYYLDNFGPQVFEGRSWYAGSSPGGGANYQMLEHEGIRIAFLNFSIDHPQSEVDWANAVVSDNPDTIFIIGTHRYLFDFKLAAGRYGEAINSAFGPLNIDECCIETVDEANNGQALFDEFVSQHPNVLMIHAGHFHSEWLRLNGVNKDGERIIEILTDYQDTRNGGDGWLRLYELDFDAGTFRFNTYSPTLDRYRSTVDHFVETIFQAYHQREQLMAVLGLSEPEYFGFLESLKQLPEGYPTGLDGFLNLHPDFDEPAEREYYNQLLADLFLGEIPAGFETIAQWQGLWLAAFAKDPSNPLDFGPGPRSPGMTLAVNYESYYMPTLQQAAERNVYRALSALEDLEPGDFLLKSARKVLSGMMELTLQQIDRSQYKAAQGLLDNTVLRRMDGCHLRGEPDTRTGIDTVSNCPAQDKVYPFASEARGKLAELVAQP